MREVEKLVISAIVEAVAAEYNVTAEQIMSVERVAPIAEARQMSMMLLFEGYSYTISEVAAAFGRNRSTALYGVRHMRELLEVDKTARAHAENIRARVAVKAA